MYSKTIQNTKKLYLEGIRGLASFVVVLIHFLPMIGKSEHIGIEMMRAMELYQPHYLNPMIHIFYLLSGRVLTASILRHAKIEALGSSIIRRPFRLLLPCFGILIFTNLYWFFLFEIGFYAEWHYANLYQVFVLPTQFVMWDGRSDNWPIPYPWWTISHEFLGSMHVYILTFIMLTFKDCARARYLIYAVDIYICCIFQSWLANFAMGLLIADLAQSGLLEAYKKFKFSIPLTAIIFVFVTYLTHHTLLLPLDVSKELRHHPNFIDLFVHPLQVRPDGQAGAIKYFDKPDFSSFLWCTTTLLTIEVTPSIQKFFNHRVFVYLGSTSFMLYLVHLRIIDSIGEGWLIEFIGYQTLAQRLVIIGVMAFILLVLAHVLTIIVDQPILRLIKWMERVVLLEDWSSSKVYRFFRALVDDGVDKVSLGLDSGRTLNESRSNYTGVKGDGQLTAVHFD